MHLVYVLLICDLQIYIYILLSWTHMQLQHIAQYI